MKKNVMILLVLMAIVLIGLFVSSYFIYFFMNKCDTNECFNNALAKCKKTMFIKENPDTTMGYTILGEKDNKCSVNVELLQIKQGSSELAVLEGKEMTCMTDLGVISTPEQNLKNCHGLLKEEIQSIIIQRMHAQIIENIGKIGEETTKII
jgi:hypothetical protein